VDYPFCIASAISWYTSAMMQEIEACSGYGGGDGVPPYNPDDDCPLLGTGWCF